MLILNEVSNPSNMAGQRTSDKSGANLAKKKKIQEQDILLIRTQNRFD